MTEHIPSRDGMKYRGGIDASQSIMEFFTKNSVVHFFSLKL
jgi:hypothetical protein